ncbi:MAG: hypothetical protein B0D92_06895 [Spirochaeta sp. LUC14_002_19_P3]|nr:MAG: hypothetical protein B0D92_06895 [Spirochaeta sp. LUC14_002_19_P3]
MTWTKLDSSKSCVRNEVKKLLDNNITLEEKRDAIQVVANFRSAHSYPMQSMIGHIRKKAFQVDKHAIVVRRLKRIPSILAKLKRFPGMQITNMGDIGGIRVIVKEFKHVQQLQGELIKSRTKHRLCRHDNYLENPKVSGYRSIHLTYKYQGGKGEYHGFRVEIQLRSKVQHAWATAVEVVGTFLGENLKASQGNTAWLHFFQLVSKAFACLETNTAIDDALKHNIQQDMAQLKVEDTLNSFTLVARSVPTKADGFYLLRLDTKEKTITAQFISKDLLPDAYEDYRRIELEIAEDPTQDVVLVSAKSLKELKLAYPNYFADTYLFLNNLKKILNLGKH